MLLKLLHITLAIAVYLSTGGFGISTHHCGGHLVDVSFFGVAQDCYGNVDGSPCDKSGSKSTCKKGCCDDSMEFFKSESEFDAEFIGFINIEIPNITDISLLFHFSPYFEKIIVKDLSYLLKPPIVVMDILVRLQDFLL